jgi:Rv0078B-related antitoxin
MTPKAALEKQVEKYRAMTGEERLKVALELHALSCEIARDGIRHQRPEASADEVERLLRERIALAQSL